MNKMRRHQRCHRVTIGLLVALSPLTFSSNAQAPTQSAHVAKHVAKHVTEFAAASPAAPMTYRSPQRTSPVTASAESVLDVKAFEAMAEQLTYSNRVPGLAMAIVQNGQVLSAQGYGVTDVSNPQPVDAHTVFRLASLSKAFAATMAGLLVNDGLLRWDSKVVDYVPSFQLSEPNATRELTVAEVLSHRVGLTRNAYDNEIESNTDYYTLSHRLASAPLRCQPGECYAYQNVAFSLIGDVAFAASGSFYEQLVERRIFKPLGMNDASTGLAGIQASPHWAHPHVRSRNGWLSLVPKPTYYRLAPAAGVNASASDMAQWLLAHTGHRPNVLPVPLLATLHASVISTPGEMRSGWRRERVDSAGYALGWRVFNYAGHQVVFHAGAVQGYRGLIALLPERDLGVAILWNGESGLPSGLMPTILDRALGLPGKRWIDIDTDGDFGNDNMLAERPDLKHKGVSSSKSVASPR